ncbi:sigma factor-like helix-turn-helix DNA-binding protein [Blastococcus sp. Marseille-P5729]|uniref:sigma factor-like helix-turn-helix DNA-binding protein n=1 Tax=Blastococcus sp. Marseille-P5729 TaxID=2086582 RepID=UPI000D104381|nr:sigma factor-like helix-turn-helix DNA-binding protein [Blastococcus sp. Marseille-P5729]
MSRPRTRAELTEAVRPFQRRLLELCYRMLGSVDAAQEQATAVDRLLWKERSRIAADGGVEHLVLTLAARACVEIAERERHHRQVVAVPLPPEATVVVAAQAPWVQPLPDLADGAERPIGLDTVTALAHLSAVQRACIVLRYGLGWSTPVTAEALGLSIFGAHSTTQRGRDALRARLGRTTPPSARAGLSEEDRTAAERYCRAVESGDDRVVAECLRHDVIVTHQPGAAGNQQRRPQVLRGHEEVLRSWAPLLAAGSPVGARLELIGSCAGRPVVLSSIRPDDCSPYRPFALEVLGLRGNRVSELANFDPALARHFE